MITVPRESISLALFALFTPLRVPTPATAPDATHPFVTVSRLWPDAANVDRESKPALFLVEWDENDDQNVPFGLEKYNVGYRLFVFAEVPQNGSVAPGSILNPLLDAVDGAIRNAATNFQTLNTVGIVNVWINPNVRKWAAAGATNQCAGMFEIKVLTGE
jgi:hypothetical protein